ncbi:hypothetical protein N825_13350 [Skermanella stibiiresistens SB22]|uniref:TIGR02588 family protein n=1 Tax=Skermanella stibiiresistens SB22 TaxID=1385369 RepID=W9H425_9PROT|nr:hypothetical protein [Skermanella stibiiresistens]EWY38513.1 hypothetical protein N825_13350 [Skermanella stibiiresistens SB22]
MSDAEHDAAGAREKLHTPVLEWLLGGVGLLLVAAAVAFLAWSGTTQGDRPPEIHVEVERVIRQRDGWLVMVRAYNAGGEAAAELLIRGRLAGGNGSGGDGSGAEESELRLDYLPSRSDRRGGLFFTRDPGSGQLTVRAIGYAEP